MWLALWDGIQTRQRGSNTGSSATRGRFLFGLFYGWLFGAWQADSNPFFSVRIGDSIGEIWDSFTLSWERILWALSLRLRGQRQEVSPLKTFRAMRMDPTVIETELVWRHTSTRILPWTRLTSRQSVICRRNNLCLKTNQGLILMIMHLNLAQNVLIMTAWVGGLFAHSPRRNMRFKCPMTSSKVSSILLAGSKRSVTKRWRFTRSTSFIASSSSLCV